MDTKVEIIITTNDRYMFVYISKDDVLSDSVIIPKAMGIFTRRKLIQTIIKSTKKVISDIIIGLTQGGE